VSWYVPPDMFAFPVVQRSNTACNLLVDVELLGEISPFALDPVLDFTAADLLYILPNAAMIAIIALLEHSAVVKILSVQDSVEVRFHEIGLD